MARLKAHPALFIVDMQNGSVHKNGSFTKLGMPVIGVEPIVSNINRLRDLCHAAGIPVYFTEMSFKDDYSDAGILASMVPGLEGAKGFIRGTWDAAIMDELKVKDNETLVLKNRNSAFMGTDLADRLREKGIDQIIATGVGTNVCVESTVRDAFNLGFHVVTISDATGTVSPEAQAASMTNLFFFGGTATTQDLEAELQARKA